MLNILITKQQIYENLRPMCVIMRKGYRGNRAVRKLFSLCYAPIVNPNGTISSYGPISSHWMAYVKRSPINAEFYAAEFVRAINLGEKYKYINK